MPSLDVGGIQCFNPRRPRGRRREAGDLRRERKPVSIHAARGGGDIVVVLSHNVKGVSIHAARGGGDRNGPIDRGSHGVSIHAARGGGDASKSGARSVWGMFQSTPPAGAATSISPSTRSRKSGFNPRRPRGRRPAGPQPPVSPPVVSIHAARGGGDIPRRSMLLAVQVSIHAARGGGDLPGATAGTPAACFNPRRPRGRRPNSLGVASNFFLFQSTPPAGAATQPSLESNRWTFVSIHAARGGGDSPPLTP